MIDFGAIVEARMTSKRLPGKVMQELIPGFPMIDFVLKRARNAKNIKKVILATTTNGADDILVDHCKNIGFRVFRGSEEDVMGRCLAAAEEAKIKNIVRLTGDNPFIDPALIDDVILFKIAGHFDYVATTMMGHSKNWSEEREFPRGISVEVMNLSTLQSAALETRENIMREFTTFNIYNNPDRWSLGAFKAAGAYSSWNKPELRLTVDTRQDQELARRVLNKLNVQNPADFSTHNIIKTLIQNNYLVKINKNIQHNIASNLIKNLTASSWTRHMNKISQKFKEVDTSPQKLDAIVPEFRYAKIKPTNNCNSKCITCTYWEKTYRDELTLEEIISSMEQLRNLGVAEIMFTGGEPTLRMDLSEMVQAAHEIGFEQIGITTNSLSLSETRLRNLLNAGLTEIVLSFEGPELHDEIRGVNGNTKKVFNLLSTLTTLRDLGQYQTLDIRLATTVMNKNFREIPKVLDIARKHGVMLFLNLIDDGTYFFRGTDSNLFAMENTEDYNQLIDDLIVAKISEPKLIGNSISALEYARRYFSDPKQSEIPCYLGYIGCEVDANGDVFSNCWGLPPVGNIRKRSLTEILCDDNYKSRCQAMYNKRCDGCSCGYILNFSYH